MKNAIYQGTILHHRLRPKEHRFTYEISYYFFDLENPQSLHTVPLIFDFKAKNYLDPSHIRQELTAKFGEPANSVRHIYILTQLSYLGFCFNPVSFYYCYGEDENLLYILSHITNTPWGEKHLDCFDYQKNKGKEHFPKEFHVSPFMPMEIDYVWNFTNPQETLHILMSNQLRNKKDSFFMAKMDLKFKELNYKNTLSSFIFYPLMSFKTVAGIYWQALILYLKKVPFHSHPKKRGAI